MLRLLAFVLPLGLDSFAVAAAIGAVQGTGAGRRLRISLVFVAFEGGMPLIGLGLGSAWHTVSGMPPPCRHSWPRSWGWRSAPASASAGANARSRPPERR